MICRQVFDSFRASSDDGGLQSSDGAVPESRGIGEIADYASGRGRQTRVGFDAQADTFRFSGHCQWPERLRRLPGNRDNSRARLSKGGRLAAPCRWCSTFHRRSALPASHIARKGSDLAYGPLQKTLPEHGRRGKAKVRAVRESLTSLGGRTARSRRASLTRWRARASIDSRLSHWNGIHRNSSQKRAS